jgi:hypothetical protein
MISRSLFCLSFALVLAATMAAAQSPAVPPASWPRQVNVANAAVLVYPPQVTRWTDNIIAFRSALALKPGSTRDETFGMVEATATTHVDKVSRTVALTGLKVAKVDFAALPDRGASMAAPLAAALATTFGRVSLDRLQASLAATSMTPPTVAVSNTPPRVIVSTSPAILVPIDGAPVWKPVAGSAGFTRIVNTRALIMKSPAAPQMFMRVYDGWLMANSLDGPWTQPFLPPSGMDAVAQKIAATRVVDLLDGGRKANPKPSLAQGIPVIYTTQSPAELIVFKGNADFAPIVGTSLAWASNTTSDVLRDSASNAYYVLLAGRWFRAASLTGPWTFVASDALPADFARIPPESLAGAVLPAVAGTPQAREAVIENATAQTATVPRTKGPAFTPTFDGSPQFVDEPGTGLARAVNASVPLIRVAPDAYYAVKAGVWFTAAQATGPWSVATSVPAAIYAIPPTSPIYFVTFVRIYGSTPDVVFEGYTPGYLGAMIAPGGTVVYGTGYSYSPWIGNAWYPAPATYGLAASPVFNPRVGYTYGFAVGLATAEWSQPFFGGARFHPGYWGHYPCCGSTSANVYRAWFKPAKAKKPKSAPAAVTAAATSAAPPAFDPAAANALANSGPQVPIRHMGPTRGYDMSMVSNADSANAGPVPATPAAPSYISANEYYASLAKNGGWDPNSASNNTYADADGKVYRKHPDGWQQHSPSGWTAAPSPPPAVAAEAQARANVDPGMQAGSFSMSNTTRFTGAANDGWTRRDSGDGGYSRTLGGDGGISAEYNAYNQAVLNNEFDIAANGGWWSDAVVVGWGGRLGGD